MLGAQSAITKKIDYHLDSPYLFVLSVTDRLNGGRPWLEMEILSDGRAPRSLQEHIKTLGSTDNEIANLKCYLRRFVLICTRPRNRFVACDMLASVNGASLQLSAPWVQNDQTYKSGMIPYPKMRPSSKGVFIIVLWVSVGDHLGGCKRQV